MLEVYAGEMDLKFFTWVCILTLGQMLHARRGGERRCDPHLLVGNCPQHIAPQKITIIGDIPEKSCEALVRKYYAQWEKLD